MIDIDAALAALTTEQKCRLLTGATTWRTMDYSEAGVPPIKVSDGPAGVRGEGHGGSGTPGVVVPSAITLGSTWDPDLAGQIGELLGTEARADYKKVTDVTQETYTSSEVATYVTARDGEGMTPLQSA